MSRTDDIKKRNIKRRHVLRAGAGALAGFAFPDFAFPDLSLLRPAGAQELPLTPQCDADAKLTSKSIEGPFFKPKSPLESDLRRSGLKGEPMQLYGFVLGPACRPLANVLVDLWHADGDGEYDNKGFRGRGHQFTDERGRYRFLTVRPGLYPGRTRHFHVKVQAANGPILTTQLYFPDEPRNERDGLFRRDLLMNVAHNDKEPAGRFDFVISAA